MFSRVFHASAAHLRRTSVMPFTIAQRIRTNINSHGRNKTLSKNDIIEYVKVTWIVSEAGLKRRCVGD